MAESRLRVAFQRADRRPRRTHVAIGARLPTFGELAGVRDARERRAIDDLREGDFAAVGQQALLERRVVRTPDLVVNEPVADRNLGVALCKIHCERSRRANRDPVVLRRMSERQTQVDLGGNEHARSAAGFDSKLLETLGCRRDDVDRSGGDDVDEHVRAESRRPGEGNFAVDDRGVDLGVVVVDVQARLRFGTTGPGGLGLRVGPRHHHQRHHCVRRPDDAAPTFHQLHPQPPAPTPLPPIEASRFSYTWASSRRSAGSGSMRITRELRIARSYALTRTHPDEAIRIANAARTSRVTSAPPAAVCQGTAGPVEVGARRRCRTNARPLAGSSRGTRRGSPGWGRGIVGRRCLSDRDS